MTTFVHRNMYPARTPVEMMNMFIQDAVDCAIPWTQEDADDLRRVQSISDDVTDMLYVFADDLEARLLAMGLFVLWPGDGYIIYDDQKMLKDCD
jgi:hypothetical protein